MIGIYLNREFSFQYQVFWKSDIESKSFTKYLNPGVLKIGSGHYI